MGIFFALAGLGLFVSFNLYRGYILRAERDTLATLLQKARSQAIQNVGASPHGLKIEEQNFILFRGVSYAARNQTYDEAYERQGTIIITGPTEIVFSPLLASTSNSLFTLAENLQLFQITVNEQGAIVF